MKSAATILIVASQLASVLAGVAARDAAKECGILGVLTPEDVAGVEDIDLTKLRKCKEHPSLLKPGPDSSENKRDDNGLQRRECWYKWGKDDFACSKDGWCYEKCGDNGQWCWQAWNYGGGDWRSCKWNGECVRLKAVRCATGGCKACGCSC